MTMMTLPLTKGKLPMPREITAEVRDTVVALRCPICNSNDVRFHQPDPTLNHTVDSDRDTETGMVSVFMKCHDGHQLRIDIKDGSPLRSGLIDIVWRQAL